MNPNNQAAVSRMLNARLVLHGQTFRITNETFRRFRTERRRARRRLFVGTRRRVRALGNDCRTTGVTVAFGLAGLLLLTQEQLVDAWISYVPALAPAIPTVWKVLAGVQKGKSKLPLSVFSIRCSADLQVRRVKAEPEGLHYTELKTLLDAQEEWSKQCQSAS